MKKASLILLLSALVSCTSVGAGDCKHKATFCATVVSNKYPVRIAKGKIDGANHVQAQYKDGTWKWLHMVNNECYEGDRDKGFVVTGYSSLREFIDFLNVFEVTE
jgi:hypothetical protein